MVRIAIVDNAPVCQTILTGLCRRYETEQGTPLDVTVFDDGDAFVASYTPFGTSSSSTWIWGASTGSV